MSTSINTIADQIYKIARDPDTVIILPTPLTQFAVWGGITAEQRAKKSSDTTQASHNEGSAAEESASLSDNPSDSDEAETSKQVTIGVTDLETDCGESLCESVQTSSSSPSAADYAGGDNFDEVRMALYQEHGIELPTGGAHYLVSSEHLKLASPIFASMVSSNTRIGGTGGFPGRFHIVIGGNSDEEALHNLLNILHLKNRQVPGVVDIEMLAKIAVLVDRYQCCEATEVFTAMWITATMHTQAQPKTYCRELILWLYIIIVFRLETLFPTVTAIAIAHNPCGVLDTLGLPIPAPVTGKSCTCTSSIC